MSFIVLTCYVLYSVYMVCPLNIGNNYIVEDIRMGYLTILYALFCCFRSKVKFVSGKNIE